MNYLILCIVVNVLTVSVFKIFERYNIHTFTAIVCNYISCFILGNIISDNPIVLTAFWQVPWFSHAFILGILFIGTFVCIGYTTQKLGLSVSMVSAKLSVVIPVGVAILFYNESASWIKIIGILISLFAVYGISKKEQTGLHIKTYLGLPVLVFVGSGIIDALLNYTENTFIPPYEAGNILTLVFGTAAVFGLLVLSVMHFYKPIPFSLKNMIGGIGLGLPNYFSMYLLLLTLHHFKESSQVFPINNIGIAGLSTLVSLMVFKEKLNTWNWAGLGLALVAIYILSMH